MSIATYSAVGKILGMPLWDRNALIGFVVILGVALLYASGFRYKVSLKYLILLIAMASGVYAIYFSLEHILQKSTHTVFSIVPTLSTPMIVAYIAIMAVQVFVIWIQSSGLVIKRESRFYPWYIHLRNGFYLNTIFDRLLGSYSLKKWRNL